MGGRAAFAAVWAQPLGRPAAAPAAAACCGKHPPAALPAAAGFLLYVAAALASTLYLIFRVSSEVQTSNILVYVAICSIVGSLSGERQGRANATQAACAVQRRGWWLVRGEPAKVPGTCLCLSIAPNPRSPPPHPTRPRSHELQGAGHRAEAEL